MNDDLGNRMKEQYENRTRTFLPRRTYTVVRVDGKAFHTFVKDNKCEKPFDARLEEAMNAAGLMLCRGIQGARLAFLQSDEISLLLTDFDNIRTSAYFDGNIQKITSVTASMATAAFNANAAKWANVPALFDSRCFTIPDPTEVENYFIWRQKDAIRNSVQAVGQTYFTHKELEGLSSLDIQEKLRTELEIEWNDLPPNLKRGRTIIKGGYEGKWILDYAIPEFTRERNYLTMEIPQFSRSANE